MRRVLMWLGVPAAFALGYWVIGPRYAGDTKLAKIVQEGRKEAEARLSSAITKPNGGPSASEALPESSPDSEPTLRSEPKPDASDVPAPKVSVGVKPVDSDASPDAPPMRRRHHRRHPVEASDEAPPETTTVPDRTGPDPASTP